MHEEADLAVEVLLLGHPPDDVGGDHQVVVVDPDERDCVGLRAQVVPQRAEGGLGKGLVDLVVGFPLLLAEDGPTDASRHWPMNGE